MAYKIEVFTANCPLCLDTIKAVKEATKECGCEVIERRCEGTECCELAKNYNIKEVPTIVVNRRIMHVGRLSSKEFKQHI